MEIKESSKEIWLTEKESHNLPCDVSLTGQCPNVKFTWHVLKESSYEWLDLGSGSLKYSVMNQGALEVKSFDVSDSGIYYCGVAGNHKRIIGNGTVVTVTGGRRFAIKVKCDCIQRGNKLCCLLFVCVASGLLCLYLWYETELKQWNRNGK